MKKPIYSSFATRWIALSVIFVLTAAPGLASAAGMGGSMGGGPVGGGGGGPHGGGGSQGGFHGPGAQHSVGGGWHGGRAGWGPRVFVGVGSPFWYPYGWYPYGYAYSYPVPAYTPAPVVVESSPQSYIQQDNAPAQSQAYWYFCGGSQTYYPYVKECPGGWLQVVPQTSPPQPSQ